MAASYATTRAEREKVNMLFDLFIFRYFREELDAARTMSR